MDVEMVAAPGLEQTAADAAMDHSTDIQVLPHARNSADGHSNNASSQKQCPKPRLVHNLLTHVSSTNPEDMFSLQSRIYLTVPSMDAKMVSAPGLKQTATDAAMDHPTDIQLLPHARSPVDGHLNNASSQQQCLKPRLVHNPSTHVSQTNPEDTCHLQSRIYPAVPSMIKQMTTMTSASARLVAAEEGLVGKSQEGQLALNASLEDPEHQGMHSTIPVPLSYNGANPFAPCPPPLPEQCLEHHPEPGMHLPFPQHPDLGPGDNHMQYLPEQCLEHPPEPGMHLPFPQHPDLGPGDNHMQYNNTGWYPSQHGPYGPMPYMLQHYHPAYHPPNLHGAAIPQSEHPDHNIPT